MKTTVKYYCPKCLNDELEVTHTEDAVQCMNCGKYSELEEVISKERVQDQPSQVPYKYHKVSKGNYISDTLDQLKSVWGSK